MPEHESWFSLYLPGLAHAIEALTRDMNVAITGQEGTWLNHEHYGHGGSSVDHVVTALFLLVVIGGMAIVAGGRLKDAKAALIPEETLTVRTFFELFIGGVLGMMEPIMGKKAARYFLPLIGELRGLHLLLELRWASSRASCRRRTRSRPRSRSRS
jgi:F-type H+-transporting ATPase subunit a